LSSIPTFSQIPGKINLSVMDDIPSPFSTLDDDDDDFNFNSKAKDTSQRELYTIKTMFNPLKDRNIKVGYTNENRDSFTKKERNFAMKAIQCESLEDLSQKVGDFFYSLQFQYERVFSLENSYNVGRRL
jgi:hypothetical protein